MFNSRANVLKLLKTVEVRNAEQNPDVSSLRALLLQEKCFSSDVFLLLTVSPFSFGFFVQKQTLLYIQCFYILVWIHSLDPLLVVLASGKASLLFSCILLILIRYTSLAFLI